MTAPDAPIDRFRPSRRAALRAGLYGGGAIALGGVVVVPVLAEGGTAAAAALGAGTLGAGTLAAGAGSAGQAATAAAATAVGSYDFNQGWLFGGAYTTGAEKPGSTDRILLPVTVPHTVVPLSWTDWNYQSWEQRWIYRKYFDGAGLAGDGDRVLLTFDGVMTDATVVLNGVTLGTHAGGYLPFTVELTGALRAGLNLLAVIVDGRWLDVPPDALAGGPDTIDYLQRPGIYRDVTLQVVPSVYLADVFARPLNVLASDRSVRVAATIDAGDVGSNHDVTVTTELLTSAGAKLAEASAVVRLKGAGTSAVTLTIGRLGDVDYWSPENPALYAVRTTLTHPGSASHTVTTTIGFRQAVFETGGFYLNGSRYEIFGLNRHQLFPYLGMAAPARLQQRDALTLKNELNVNMVRCSHYPQSPHFLDACDELGIMVWQEPPGWGFMGDAAFQQRFLSDVTSMVVRDRNRPSGRRLGHQARRDQELPRPVRQRPRARRPLRRVAADGRGGHVPFHRRLGRGRVLLRRLPHRRRRARALPACGRSPVPGQRGGRRGGGPDLPVVRPARDAGQPGPRARPGARPGAGQPALRRPAGVGRDRLLRGPQPRERRGGGQELEQHAHPGGARRLPRSQARRVHLPVADRPGRPAGDHSLLLVGQREPAGRELDVRHQLRPARALGRRRALADGHPGRESLRRAALPARVRRPVRRQRGGRTRPAAGCPTCGSTATWGPSWPRPCR